MTSNRRSSTGGGQLPPGQMPFRGNGTCLLGPGEWACGTAPGCIETLLGSCVCISFYHPLQRVGAACHYLLPSPPSADGANDPRYGSVQFRLMLAELRRVGADPRACEVKMFGGGRMFDLNGPDIGARNIEQGEAMLRELGVNPIARDLGGDGYRRLRFDLADGAVWMRFDLARPLPAPSGGRHGE